MKTKRFVYYIKIWIMMAKNSLLNWSTNRNVFAVFLLGKIIRYTAFFGFLYFLVKGTNGFLGYTRNQALFFTAYYVFIDTVSQFLFRSVYTFRSLIVNGDFDLILTKPINPLFRVLMGGPDPIDFVTIPVVTGAMIWFGIFLSPNWGNIVVFILLSINSFLIAAALHIFVLGVGIVTLEVDHLVMVYRDLESMGRFPVDIYKKPLGIILTYIVPIGLMMTVPAKALGGLVGVGGVIVTLIIGVILFFSSLRFWNFALTKYTSASS